MKKSALAALSVAAFMAAIAQASAANDATAPAVSGLNGSADIRGGAEHGNMTGLLSGSVSAPVTHSTGVQFDGTIGGVGGVSVEGFEAHAFYRDPARFLLGPTFERVWVDESAYNRYGAEAEYYYNDKLTYTGRVGYQAGDIHDGEYTQLDVSWYLNDNLAIVPGFRNSVDHYWGRTAIEWQPQAVAQAPGLTLFASTGAGNYGYAFGLVGIKYYFGNDKSLKQREREDDPGEIAPEEMMNNATVSHPHQDYTYVRPPE
ncbi:MAG: hypothetical protein P4M15_02845 [Alphaproteobacteria bacterium]|nr:hypothetical protein [Alphaproteobacteria bacterium]